MRRKIIVFAVIGFLLAWAIAVHVGQTYAQANPIVKKIPYVKKEIEVITIEPEPIYIIKEVEFHWYQFHATGYSPDDPAQGTNRTMASGNEVYEGAVAVDPKVIPLGTRIEIKGLPDGRDGIYVAEDTGGAIKQNRVDIFYESKSDALKINYPVWVRILD